MVRTPQTIYSVEIATLSYAKLAWRKTSGIEVWLWQQNQEEIKGSVSFCTLQVECIILFFIYHSSSQKSLSFLPDGFFWTAELLGEKQPALDWNATVLNLLQYFTISLKEQQ